MNVTVKSRAHYLDIVLILSILAGLLTGCIGTTSDPDPGQQPLRLSEDKPYPDMDDFSFEAIPFGFALRLSYRPVTTQEILNVIDIDKTIAKNSVPPTDDAHGKLRQVLKSFQDGSISEISVIGRDNKTLSLKGATEQDRDHEQGKSITYSMETNPGLEMVCFKKETRLSKEYLQKNSFTVEAFIDELTRTYGKPHHTFAKSNSSGIHKDLWWGADGTHLITSEGYDFANGSHWKGFRGKTFYVSIHNYSDGDIQITQTMKDNFRAFRNELSEG